MLKQDMKKCIACIENKYYNRNTRLPSKYYEISDVSNF